MKKAALLLGIIFALGATVVSWKLLHSGPTTAAQFLSRYTIALVEVPDLPAATAHWKESELGKLVAEPEMQAFLSRPLDRLLQMSGLGNSITVKKLADFFTQAKPGRFFAALEPSPKAAAWITGCQFFGSKSSMEESLQRLMHALETSLGASNEALLKAEEHHGELIKKRTYPTLSLFTAMHGNWCFVSNDLAALEQTLDLCAGRKASSEALLHAELYQKNHRQLFSPADFFCYLIPHPALKQLPIFSSLFREDPLMQLAQAAGASFRFIPEGVEERVFLNGNFKIEKTIAHRGLRFTQPTSLGYVERLNNWKQIVDHLKNNPALPPHLAAFFTTSGLDLNALADLLKPEVSFIIDWAQGYMLPSVLLTAPELDSIKMANWLDQTAPQLETVVQASDQNDLLMVSMPKVTANIQPSFGSANGTFFISTDPNVLTERSCRKASVPTLEQAPGFIKNAAFYRAANEAFFYFSAKEIFERAYALARPALFAGGAFFPNAKTFLDFSRLPATKTVAGHLTPVVIAQSHEEEGFLIQSRGPLSATPLFLIGKMAYQTFFLKHAPTPEVPPAQE